MTHLISVRQILAEYASNEYSAELLLKHAIEHLKMTQQQAEPVRWMYEDGSVGDIDCGHTCIPLYAAPPAQPEQPAPIQTRIDMDRMLYAYNLLPDDVKKKLSLNMLDELRKALNLTFIPTPGPGLTRPSAPGDKS